MIAPAPSDLATELRAIARAHDELRSRIVAVCGALDGMRPASTDGNENAIAPRCRCATCRARDPNDTQPIAREPIAMVADESDIDSATRDETIADLAQRFRSAADEDRAPSFAAALLFGKPAAEPLAMPAPGLYRIDADNDASGIVVSVGNRAALVGAEADRVYFGTGGYKFAMFSLSLAEWYARNPRPEPP